MGFTEEKKQQLRLYLLEKIAQRQTSVVQKTVENFGVTPATVYKYLDRLTEDGTVRKIKRGEYALVSNTEVFRLNKIDPAFSSEDTIYARTVRPLLANLPANVRGIWDYLCGEMLNNVIDHSLAEHLEITLTQNELNTTIQIADDGVGIFEKIRTFLGLDTPEEAVGELFKRKRITYIGWGVPVSGNNWEQVYIGIRSDAERSEYLVYCGDESELPDYSRNRKAKVSWVIGDWYRIVFYGKDPTMGG